MIAFVVKKTPISMAMGIPVELLSEVALHEQICYYSHCIRQALGDKKTSYEEIDALEYERQVRVDEYNSRIKK